MLSVHTFTFNPYEEKTYLIFDEDKNCAIVDPGCYSQTEQRQLTDFIDHQQLQPKFLLNTHGHIDHMLGNRFVKDRYELEFITHQGVIAELEATQAYGALFGLKASPSPPPDRLVDEGDVIELGKEKLEILFTPGHSAGHISFYHRESGQLFSGDVLFHQSIGRTDLPGGDYPTLMNSIFNKLIPLGEEVVVYPGHGPSTTIGEETRINPFILQHWNEFMS